MASKDPRIDLYIAKAAPFAQPILQHLRDIVHAGCPQVDETLKWSMPHFDHKGVLCGMAAFTRHCTFGFWKAAPIVGDDKPGNSDAMGHFGRITSLADLPPDSLLIGYVRKAVELNDAGVKSPTRSKPKAKPEPLVVPDYFRDALRNNRKAETTFDGFSYSKQKDYIEWVTEAKRAETRDQRLATAVEWLAEGKPRMWKYQR
ncbi:MAG: YdeI/OmpD-associated family protein [Chthoniobacterales bacterium]|nr:YdeI/OmpD-associated family protein [Chthoniobacterales bacterium]